MRLFAVILDSSFLYCYIVLSSIEFGASIFNLWPGPLGGKAALKNYLSPVWETTNVFLVFFIVGIFTFFPGAVIYFGTNLMPLLFTALVLAGLRSACMLLIFYGDIKNKFIDWLFLLCCFLFPLVLCGFYAYCLTGQFAIIPAGFLSWALWLFAIAVILLISISFFQYYSEVNLSKAMGRSAVLFITASAVLMAALAGRAPYLFANGFSNLLAGLALLVSITAFFFTLIKGKPAFIFLSACLTVGTIFFCLIALHQPYLIYPIATVNNSFTDPAAFSIMMWCLPIGLILVVPALILLYSLFGSKKSTYIKY